MSLPALEDLSKASVAWLDDTDPVGAFASWINTQPERVQVGFASLGVRPPVSELTVELRRIASHRALIRAAIADERWRERVAQTFSS